MDINYLTDILKLVRFKNIIGSLLTIGFSISYLNAQSMETIGRESMELDPSIRYGKLTNGFIYYIKSLNVPQSKLYMNLYIKAGNNQQDPDQLNIAHAVEHLAFEATKNLPNGIRGYLEALEEKPMGQRDYGGSAGPRIVDYHFNPPNNNNEIFRTGLLWFKEIATGLILSRKDIDEERGVLRQEFIYREGDRLNEYFLESRLMSQLLPCRCNEANFFEHQMTFPVETLRRFYRDWYRPDLMALSIVGNIEDMDALENQVITSFANISPHRNPRKLIDCDSVYFSRPPQFFIPEREPDSLKTTPNEDVQFYLFFRDGETKNTIDHRSGLNRLIIWQIFIDILRERLKNETFIYNSSVKISGTHTYKLDNSPSSMRINITSENNKEEEGIRRTIKILKQLKKYGISQGEWEKAKFNVLQSLNAINLESPEFWIEEIKKHFSRGEALPPNKIENTRVWLGDFSVQKFNIWVSKLYSDMPQDIGIIAPTGHESLQYSEKQVREWIWDAYSDSIQSYIFPKIPNSLIDPSIDSKLSRNKYRNFGMDITGSKEIMFGNGVKVILKSFKPNPGLHSNRVILHGFSPNGASCFPEIDFYSAINGPSIIQNAGIGNLDKFNLKRFLAGTNSDLSVRTYIDFQESGIIGNSSIKDLEKLFQMVYLSFTRPRKDVEAFEDWKKTEEKMYQNPPSAMAMTDFHNSIRKTMGNNSISNGGGILDTRLLLGTKRYKGLSKTYMNESYAIYQNLFGNVQDFTFIISGDFEIRNVLPLVQKYLGNLPKVKNPIKCFPQNLDYLNLPRGPYFDQIPTPRTHQMHNVLYGIKYLGKTKAQKNWKEELKIKVLGAILDLKARTLRYEKGFSLYNINAFGKYDNALSRYEVNLELDCVQEEFIEVQKECRRIISEINVGLISNELFDQTINRLYYLYDPGITGQHVPIQLRLYEYFRFGSPWIESADIEQFLKSLTLDDIVSTAKIYFKDENLYQFVMGN